jgi:hypothetical protein
MAHPGGRPPKFKSEKEFQDFLVVNSDIWIKEWFGVTNYKLMEQWYMSPLKVFGANKPRIDLCIETIDGKRIGIEVKNPKNIYGELSRSISQLLCYAVLSEENGCPLDELAIITTEYDDILIKCIKKYQLGIRVFVLNRDIRFEMI